MNEENKFNSEKLVITFQRGERYWQRNQHWEVPATAKTGLRSWGMFTSNRLLLYFTSACPSQKEKELGDKGIELG